MEGAGVPELWKFQNHLSKYNITVYNYNCKGREVYFYGENTDAKFKINLLFYNGHYNVITSLTAAFACTFYCEACHVPYEHKGEHRCNSICTACQSISPPCLIEDNGIICSDCNRRFKNQACFEAHRGDTCNRIKLCTNCYKYIFRQKNKHVCGEVFCEICNSYKPSNHKCFMKPDTRKTSNENFLYIFFDLETRQDESLPSDPNQKLHKVNLCVSQQFCYQCLEGQTCTTCTDRLKVFEENPIREFMDYVMEVRKSFKNGKVCVIAHNGQGFDFQFILKYIFENTKFTPNIISRGTKIIMMEIDNVKFIDSLNYFPMALSELPKAFDLPPERKKGYFPHLFNTLANQNYRGPMPSKDFYCPDGMFEKRHSDFEDWYNKQISQNYVFDLKQELKDYCISDVEILSQACLKFRKLLLDECNVDPFLEAVTIASACNLAFRRNFLKPNTIGLIPKNGYRFIDNQSSVALQWLTWEEEKRKIKINHAGRGREVKINGNKVDGFDGEIIYEFHGCYWHGCPKCFPYNREVPLKEDPSDTLHLRYERTKAKMEKLSDYTIVEIWECEFSKLKKENQLHHLESLPILKNVPLNPRDSFYGGRTGNTKTYYKCEEGESIQYVDVCSLYPYVCKYGKYPLGHPTIHVGDRECRERGINVDGLLRCKILPPQQLYHPVLPLGMHGKLMFILCKACGEAMNQGECEHSEEDRALIGTWTMDEIRKAVEKGYVILEMYELWDYEVATYEKGGLFTQFIDKFLKLKQEASGWPSWCKTEQDKDLYIQNYYKHEGIQLDKNKISKNGGLRSLAKLMLNSFWGKFGQRENQTKTQIIRFPLELYNLLVNPCVKVKSIQIINEEVLLVNWQYLEEVGEPLKNTNVVLATYTTAQARLKLYEHLDALGGQVLYYDTDSCIYYFRSGLYKVPTGDYLGEMTDELVEYGPGSFVTEFVSGGPKTYAYLIWSTDKQAIIPICKIKGLTLNIKTQEKLNFEALKNMVLGEAAELMDVEESRIRRTRDRDIVTIRETKIFKITGPKRKFEGQYDTLPYGYNKKQKLEL